jgi:hypothetical protein
MGGVNAAIAFFEKCFRIAARWFSAERVWRALGFDSISRDEAAQEILSREVRFQYRPAIIEFTPPAERDRLADRPTRYEKPLRS